MRPVALAPLAGSTPAPFPWTCSDDATLSDADGRCVGVLGDPFAAVTEQDVANGAAILAIPKLIAAVRDLLPYAAACIGLPRSAWPADNVILQAEALLKTLGSQP